MKVVHICSSITGGAGKAAMRLHYALLERGVDSQIVTRWDEFPEDKVYRVKRGVMAKVIERIKLYLQCIRYKYFSRVTNRQCQELTFVDAGCNFALDERVMSADVVNLHWVGNTLNYKAFFRSNKKPIVWTLHDMNPFMGMLHYQSDMKYLTASKLAIKQEKAIVEKKERIYASVKSLTIAPLCEWMKNASVKSKAFAGRKHVIVRNCVDVGVFHYLPVCSVREKFGLPSDVCLLLFVSQHVDNYRKGGGIILKSMFRWPQECRLVVVGDGEIQTSEKIISLGRIDNEREMAALYSAVDALLLPSIEDNLPNTMLESLCCGTPVLTYATGGMLDVIENGMNGYCSLSLDENGMVDMVCKFAKQGVLWDREKISSKAVTIFSPSAVANQYIKIYKDVLNHV